MSETLPAPDEFFASRRGVRRETMTTVHGARILPLFDHDSAPASVRRLRVGAGEFLHAPRQAMRFAIVLLLLAVLTGCGRFTDAATRLAYEIESNLGHLGPAEGATHVIRLVTPSQAGECSGPFKVQFDKVGALIIWCMDASGQTVSSHSTSYHRRFVDTAETYIVDKRAGAVRLIQVERRLDRPVITKVR